MCRCRQTDVIFEVDVKDNNLSGPQKKGQYRRGVVIAQVDIVEL